MEVPPPPVPGPTDTHATILNCCGCISRICPFLGIQPTTIEWTNKRIEHTYANAISEMPDISDQNTMGIRGKRIEALGLA